LEKLVHLAVQDERYTATLAVPFISFALVWSKSRILFSDPKISFRVGAPLVLVGLSTFAITTLPLHLSVEGLLAVRISTILVVWTGGFVCCYGTRAARRALFPLVFLLLTIPVPAGILDHVVVALQRGSAETTYGLFKLIGVPVFREGIFKFSLPGVTIQVAQECSGIRSSQSLFISSIVAGYLLLRSGWSRVSLALLTIPVVIFKNAVRIVTISWLGVYVDSAFLHGRLHRYGGLPFSAFALLLLIPVLLLLMRTESRQKTDS
jgi:exosortase